MHLRFVSGVIVAVAFGVAACAGSPSHVRSSWVPSTKDQARYLGPHLPRRALDTRVVRGLPAGRPPITLKGSGTLSYDEFGNLKMDIRADQASSDVLRAAGVQIVDGVISSGGRTVVDMQNRTLTYVLADQPPSGTGPLAINRPRHWQVEGTLLTLTTQDETGKPLSVGRWRKTS